MRRLHTLHTIIPIIAKVRSREDIGNGRVARKGLLAVKESVFIVFGEEGAEASGLGFEDLGAGAFASLCEMRQYV